MSVESFALVLTSIGDLAILEEYRANFERFGWLEKASVYAIPDRKTPAAAYERAISLSQRGLKVLCPSLEEQERFLQRFDRFGRLVPYDSDNRRNIGYLMAYESGHPLVLSIDDDNFCLQDEDFVRTHAVVCEDVHAGTSVNSSNGWFNVCSMLETTQPGIVYPRGFPYRFRHQAPSLANAPFQGRIAINAGLWLKDPDVDAMTWLIAPVSVKALKSPPLVLGDRTWSPINTQNTGLRSEVLPAYYFVRMNYPLGGMAIDRYGDIFSGYFALACARQMGDAIRFGTPLADHRRNSHNYLRDMLGEAACIHVLEDILPWLTSTKLEGASYADAYLALASLLEDAVEQFRGSIWTDSTRGYFHYMAYCMRAWVGACRQIA